MVSMDWFRIRSSLPRTRCAKRDDWRLAKASFRVNLAFGNTKHGWLQFRVWLQELVSQSFFVSRVTSLGWAVWRLRLHSWASRIFCHSTGWRIHWMVAQIRAGLWLEGGFRSHEGEACHCQVQGSSIRLVGAVETIAKHTWQAQDLWLGENEGSLFTLQIHLIQFQWLHTLRQGARSVDDYTNELYEVVARNDMYEIGE